MFSLTDESCFTLWHLEGDIEIPIPISSSMSLTANLDTHTILDPSRDIDIFFDELLFLSFSVTSLTLLRDDLPNSTTTRTTHRLLHDTKDSLHALAYTTIALTFLTGLDLNAILGSIATTTHTRGFSLELDESACASYCVLEGDLHAYLDILTDVSTLAIATTISTKKRLENISEIYIESSLESTKSSS